MQCKKNIYYIAAAFVCIIFGSCANIIPPGGGPKDTLPPVLVQALPKDSSLNFRSKTITLIFDEYVDLNNMQEQLIVSPFISRPPLVERKLKTITVKFLDSLMPNTTYTLDFGKGIKDINEGNIAEEFKYIFSTGASIDTFGLSGELRIAESGTVDSTMIVLLHKNLHDSAIIKLRPDYIARVSGNGKFRFENLSAGRYRLYALPNDFTKRYDDSAKLIAFYSDTIFIPEQATGIKLFAYKEVMAEAVPEEKTSEKETKKQPLYFTNLKGAKLELTDTLTIQFNHSLTVDTSKVQLYDTSFSTIPHSYIKDSSGLKILFQKQEQFRYILVLQKDLFNDTANYLAKTDTLRFSTNKESDYGSLKINFINVDTTNHPVLLIYQNKQIVEKIKVSKGEWYKKLVRPGEYELKVLYDTNQDLMWTPGNFSKHRQPEVVMALKNIISIRANWDNEVTLSF